MKKPILLIMAAGMGSRYGGLKQMDPVGPSGEFILDYSLYDAMRAGFQRAVIVIKQENEADFRSILGNRISKHFRIDYAYQDLSILPEGYTIPEGRVKPWGTGHAILCAASQIDAPFCAINADDYYGAEAFRLCYEHLTHLESDGDLCMVGYLLKNTLSESGSVARGVCDVTEDGLLSGITERLHIISTCDGPMMTEDGKNYTLLSPDTVVSMNMWGFPEDMMNRFKAGFPDFLDNLVPTNPLKAQYLLPVVVQRRLQDAEAHAKVYTTPDKWVGVTYREDRPLVIAALQEKADSGLYPTPLWK